MWNKDGKQVSQSGHALSEVSYGVLGWDTGPRIEVLRSPDDRMEGRKGAWSSVQRF